uniref:Putative calcium channel toxin Tx758 n=1 Tax=Buthus israelis TaxID=2899555 RepID=CL758_BUTIS|nr:RecName: Full=Putative calcium channel toxin Tx758; Flags: Precursor [Buthus occitanus israelis]ACJ23131.1 putative calcium channel toxin Tx758 [Buthus occitanus israelis]
MSTFVIVFLLLTAVLCHAEPALDETARGCNRLNKKCNSDGDCCRYGERCISTGVNYYCKPDFGP